MRDEAGTTTKGRPIQHVPAITDAERIAALPLFNGHPYVVTKLVPALYHLILVPAHAGEEWLLRLAIEQVRANALCPTACRRKQGTITVTPSHTSMSAYAAA
jgi:hypothetical protein